MELLLVAARLLLAAVFAAAGIAKLLDLNSARKAIADFGVSRPLARLLGTLLPPVELLVAVLLLPSRSAWWGALGALVLLLAFIAAIAINLAQGRTPDCRCFGQVHSRPIGRATLARNAALALCAGVIVWLDPGETGPGVITLLTLMSGPWTGVVLLLLLVMLVAEAWFLFHVFQQHGRLLLRMDVLERRIGGMPGQAPSGLPVGTPAPAFTLRVPGHGGSRDLQTLRDDDRALLLIFADPGCGPCAALWPEIGKWQQTLRSRLRIAVVSRGSEDENRLKATSHGIADVLLQEDSEVSNAYGVPGTPGAVLIAPNATVASQVVMGPDAIVEFIGRFADRRTSEGRPS
jgi:uncharacterized membrane protein YphA (DoxX/SURF4 family)